MTIYHQNLMLAARPRERGSWRCEPLVCRIIPGRDQLRKGEVLIPLRLTIPGELFRAAAVEVVVPGPPRIIAEAAE